MFIEEDEIRRITMPDRTNENAVLNFIVGPSSITGDEAMNVLKIAKNNIAKACIISIYFCFEFSFNLLPYKI